MEREREGAVAAEEGLLSLVLNLTRCIFILLSFTSVVMCFVVGKGILSPYVCVPVSIRVRVCVAHYCSG